MTKKLSLLFFILLFFFLTGCDGAKAKFDEAEKVLEAQFGENGK